MLISVKSSLIIEQESKIKGFYIGLYSYNLSIETRSQISSNGMGYLTNEGLGCGYTDKIIGLR